MQRNCEWCGAEFYAKPALVRKGHGRFCSRKCLGLSQRGPKLTGGAEIAHFWERVDKLSGPVRDPTLGRCWLWTGARMPAGYGSLAFRGRHTYAHRAAWRIAHGPIPDGQYVLHRCDNPPCCNPDHLFLGTHLDNIADMDAKGRRRWGVTYRNRHAASLTDDQVAEIRVEYETGGISYKALGASYGVCAQTVCNIMRGKHYSSGKTAASAAGSPDNTHTSRHRQ